MTQPIPIRLVDAVSAAPDLTLAGLYLAAWINPGLIGEGMVKSLIMTVILEFIVMHASVTLGSTLLDPSKSLEERRKISAQLFGVYMLFALGFSLAERSVWPVLFFAWLILNRFLGMYLGQGPAGQEKNMLMGLWGMSALYYILFAFATVLLPVPELGLAESPIHMGGGGLWEKEPQRALAFGALYFAANGATLLKAGGMNWSVAPQFRR